ncbi:MAG: hypothetical protein LBK66_07055 [Spirochaetaceae bacterium]|nr:hypothetical protein [Spirochaetaceae bacterium]
MGKGEIKYLNDKAIIKDFNVISLNSIEDINNIDYPIGIHVGYKPKIERLTILNEVLLHKASLVTLFLHNENINWLKLTDFQTLTNIENIRIINQAAGFSSIDGIQNFKYLKLFSLWDPVLDPASKKLDLSILKSCENLEALVLGFRLTKKQLEQISLVKSIKYLKLRSLSTRYLFQEFPNIEYLEVQRLNDTYKENETLLKIKMPNLKEIRISKTFEEFVKGMLS